VTSGATEALFAAIAAVVHAGEEVIVLDPCYDSYDPAVELAGGRAVHIPLRLPDFSVDWQRVKDAITPRTRMIMTNSPHNPSGAVLEASDLETLAEIVRGTDIFVLSDEVYEHIIFDGLAHQSVLRHAELAARSFVISSFGKTYHCTGWKVGYCIAPPQLSAEFRKVHQYLTFCTFSPAQWAFADMLESDPQHYLDLPAFYQAKRDRFRTLLAPSKFKLLPVKGAYFQLVDYSAFSKADDLNFSEWLVREAGVAAIPVSAFYETPPDARLVRLCFAKSDETLRGGGGTAMQTLRVSLVQGATRWHDPAGNRAYYGDLIAPLAGSDSDPAAGNLHQRIFQRSDPQRGNDGWPDRGVAVGTGAQTRCGDLRQRAVARR
jgi:methionine aminotransferase